MHRRFSSAKIGTFVRSNVPSQGRDWPYHGGCCGTRCVSSHRIGISPIPAHSILGACSFSHHVTGNCRKGTTGCSREAIPEGSSGRDEGSLTFPVLILGAHPCKRVCTCAPREELPLRIDNRQRVAVSADLDTLPKRAGRKPRVVAEFQHFPPRVIG